VETADVQAVAVAALIGGPLAEHHRPFPGGAVRIVAEAAEVDSVEVESRVKAMNQSRSCPANQPPLVGPKS
jgi:hypothetical protein